MRVLLVNPPSPFLIDQKAFPPLGLISLAAYIRSASRHEVAVLDLAGREAALEQALEGIEADIFGVTATTPQYPHAKKIRSLLRQCCPSAKVVLGGVHPTSLPEVVEQHQGGRGIRAPAA